MGRRRRSRRLVPQPGALPYPAPDGKTRVAIEFRQRRPYRIHGITLIVALDPRDASPDTRLRDDLMGAVIAPVIWDEPLGPDEALVIGTRLLPEGWC